MPIYQYRCGSCQHIFDEIKSVEQRHGNVPCPYCSGGRGSKMFSRCTLITDTSLPLTGTEDRRFGPGKIEGRADLKRRMKAQGLVEVDLKSDIKDNFEERCKVGF